MTLPTECSTIIDSRKLIREGTSRKQRALDALKPSHVQVDEHRPEQWMVFAQRYAEYVRFFDATDQASGDWQAFFAKDPSAILAVTAVQNVESFRTAIKGYFKKLISASNGEVDVLKKTLGHAFNALGSLAWQLDLLKESLPAEIALKGVLQNIVLSELAQAFERLIAYFKAAAAIVDDSDMDYSLDIFGAKIVAFSELQHNAFSSDWYKHSNQSSWTKFHQAIESNDSVFGGGILTEPAEKLSFAASHNLFTGIFDLFIKAYSRVVNEAIRNLQLSFTGKNDHEPHYALFLAFLRLLEYIRDHTNTLTARHLDFYYQQVLRLNEKAAEPCHAHLILQLAKHQQSLLLKAGTEFHGGKDSSGKLIKFQLQNDSAINVAKIAALKSIHWQNGRLYAFPVINSDDGRGAELTSALKQWHPFIGPTSTDNLAQVGFAIASHYLLLTEGKRKIRLTLKFNETISQKQFCEAFDFVLTGPKGWIAASLDMPVGSLSQNQTQSVEIPLVIDGGQPAIVALNTDVHGSNLPAGLPVLRALFKPDNSNFVSLSDLQKLTLDSPASQIEVAVGYASFTAQKPDATGSGVKNLYIGNRFGEIKPDKPFQPFGPMPEKGDYLLIGADEVFQKKTAQFQFRVVWKGLPDWRGDIDFDWVNEFAPLSSVIFLKNGVFDTANPDLDNLAIFSDTQHEVYFPAQRMTLPASGVAEPHFEQPTFSLDSRSGFVKLVLLDDFGHKLYQSVLGRYLIRVAKGETLETDRGKLRDKVYKLENGRYVPRNIYTFKEDFVEEFSKARPTEPYTPEIESLTLSYTASVSLGDESSTLYWLTPFGRKAANTTPTAQAFLPIFEKAGEFYLGIQALVPPQNLSLLFQLAEGSANPTVKKPDDHLHWSYLQNNDWVDFKDSELSDATAQLTRSGIIRFAIPKQATSGDSLFSTADTFWLRASVVELPDAVCKIITVTAQAVVVDFKDQDNAADFLNKPLEESRIGKLAIPDAAVKKVEQPYPSFGGRSQEDDHAFYTRVSERLRHKNRAISAWDYEHLVLEAFPFIYKVKCLNHMHLEPGANDAQGIHNELAPGHVTIVTIPNLDNHNAMDPLRPYTSLGDLDLIKRFLERRVSCFVNLHVRNPIFEAVRTDFKVKFMPGTDEAIHLALLQQEIVIFLSPWAFASGRDVSFGGKIYKSSLIDFVEEQTYVDYVTDFKLFHISEYPDGSFSDGPDLDEVQASTAISILVSAQAQRHKISAIPQSSSSTVQDQVCQC